MSCTTFAKPVVPEDMGMATTVSAGSISGEGDCVRSPSSAANGVVPPASPPKRKTSSTPASFAAGRARSRNGGTVSRNRARVARSWVAMSSIDASELTVVLAPPAAATPWKTAAYSGTFGAKMANTSPGPKPRAASPAATDRVIPASWA